jgi:hypothetical protein
MNCNRKGHTASECRQPRIEVNDRKCFICQKTGHIAKDCKEKPAPLKAILDAGPSGQQRPAVMCVQLAPPRSAQLVDHLRPDKPRRSNGNRFQPLTLADTGFWESLAPDAAEISAAPVAMSASDFPPLSPHSAAQTCISKVSLVQGEIDRINKRVFVDNSPPVGIGGSPRPRVNLSPNINVQSDRKPISQMDTRFFLFGKSL